jgi:dihydroxy-acid dehydratase
VSRKLRSNLEPGTALWAGRRAQWRALGISDEDMAKPKIAIVNSSSELSSCFSHLDGVAADMKTAIRAAGGLPFEVRTAAPSDFITSVGRRGAYILPTRDLIASDIEVQVEGALLDGMVCLASCDKTTPGQLLVEMVWQDLKPRAIITPGAVKNAVLMVLALSGSINCVKHLQAIATETELDVDVYQLFADYAEKVPLLAAIRPNGEGLIEDLEAAGGARAVLKRLERYVDPTALTVTGQTLGDELASVTVNDDRVIRTIDNPLSTRPSINIVRGNLLPGGGIVRLGGVGERTMRFTGRANIFHSRDEALAAIKQGGVKPGEVVVLRGLGVIGGPGMAMTSAVVFALDGAGLINQVAMITEGQLSGLVNNGLVVGEASPEAAAGGPLAFVENGDVITIDVNRKVVDLDVPEAVLAERRKQPRVFGAQNERGWLRVYQRTVAPVHEGAVLAR